jgi:hypothetical protein
LRRLGIDCIAASRNVEFSLAPDIDVTRAKTSCQSGASAANSRSTCSFQSLSC